MFSSLIQSFLSFDDLSGSVRNAGCKEVDIISSPSSASQLQQKTKHTPFSKLETILSSIFSNNASI